MGIGMAAAQAKALALAAQKAALEKLGGNSNEVNKEFNEIQSQLQGKVKNDFSGALFEDNNQNETAGQDQVVLSGGLAAIQAKALALAAQKAAIEKLGGDTSEVDKELNEIQAQLQDKVNNDFGGNNQNEQEGQEQVVLSGGLAAIQAKALALVAQKAAIEKFGGDTSKIDKELDAIQTQINKNFNIFS